MRSPVVVLPLLFACAHAAPAVEISVCESPSGPVLELEFHEGLQEVEVVVRGDEAVRAPIRLQGVWPGDVASRALSASRGAISVEVRARGRRPHLARFPTFERHRPGDRPGDRHARQGR